jgi:hypothetical protein
MKADTLASTIVAVDECGVGSPRTGRLVFEFQAVGIAGFNAGGNFGVNCCFDFGGDFSHLGSELANVLDIVRSKNKTGNSSA